MITFKRSYFVAAIVLFVIEVLIALYVTDRIIRPYVGDLLVVILMYCFLRSFLKVSVAVTALVVLLFAYFVEWLQYLNLVRALGWQHSKLANVVLGNHFEWIDMLAYTLGIGLVLLFERNLRKKPV